MEVCTQCPICVNVRGVSIMKAWSKVCSSSVRKFGSRTVWDCGKAKKREGQRVGKGEGETAAGEKRMIGLVGAKRG